MSDTVVIQSFRQYTLSSWDYKCIQSVKTWATNCNYDYVFYGDELFSFASPDLQNKYKNNLTTLTDYVRLIALLTQSSQYNTVIWIDSDVIVFNKHHITIPTNEGLYLCKSLNDANNTVIVNVGNTNQMQTLADQSLNVIQRSPATNKFAINGLKFFNTTGAEFNINHFGIGLFNVDMLDELAQGNHKHIVRYMRANQKLLGGANLCGSLRLLHRNSPAKYHTVIDHLIESQGRIVNQYVNNSFINNRLQNR